MKDVFQKRRASINDDQESRESTGFRQSQKNKLEKKFKNFIKKGKMGIKLLKDGAAGLNSNRRIHGLINTNSSNRMDRMSLSSSSTIKNPYFNSIGERVSNKKRSNKKTPSKGSKAERSI